MDSRLTEEQPKIAFLDLFERNDDQKNYEVLTDGQNLSRRIEGMDSLSSDNYEKYFKKARDKQHIDQKKIVSRNSPTQGSLSCQQDMLVFEEQYE